MAEIETLLADGKVEDANAKMKEVEALDSKWEEAKLANANLNALKDNTTVTNLENKSVEIKGGIQMAAQNIEINKENVIATPEYRNSYLKKLQGKDLTIQENALMTATPAIPQQTQNEILRKVKQYAPLLNEITLLQVEGNVKYVVEGTINDAALHTPGATITASVDTLIEVILTGYEINKLVTISKSVSTMSIDAFENWLTDMLAQSISNKISSYIITGTGTNEPQGIEKAQTWGATNSVTVALAASLTAANVQALVGLLPGGYDAGAKFTMSKKTLFTDFMPLQDTSKHDLVRLVGDTYYIYGYPVLFDERVTFHEAFLGNLKRAVVGNLPESVNVVSAFDIKTNSFDYLGSAIFDSKVAIGEAVVKLIKATA
jgi:HK97 family phage major capsid protein